MQHWIPSRWSRMTQQIKSSWSGVTGSKRKVPEPAEGPSYKDLESKLPRL